MASIWFRASQEEKLAWTAQAEAENITLSEWIKRQLSAPKEKPIPALEQKTLDDCVKEARLELIKEQTKLTHARRINYETQMPKAAKLALVVEGSGTTAPEDNGDYPYYCKSCQIPRTVEGMRVCRELRHDVDLQ